MPGLPNTSAAVLKKFVNTNTEEDLPHDFIAKQNLENSTVVEYCGPRKSSRTNSSRAWHEDSGLSDPLEAKLRLPYFQSAEFSAISVR